jgi:ribosomal protein S18 acetylase RimI-like enzyme
MNYSEIEFKINTATLASIINHFNSCFNAFNPPLNTYVIIEDYAKKIFDHAITIEAWDGDLLVGLSATYFNDQKNKIAFLTNLSLLKGYQNKGIATILTSSVLNYAKVHGFNRINLEVKSINEKVKEFYTKHGFVIIGEKRDCLIMSYFVNSEKKEINGQ